MKKIILAIVLVIIIVKEAAGMWDGGIASSPSAVSQVQAQETLSRDELEQQILASTVRIQMHGWTELRGNLFPINRGGKSHATIKDGRYLVTHNHFANPMQALAEGGYTGMSLYNADGELIVAEIPIENVKVAAVDTETLVLEVTDEQGNGLFDALGLPSADFISWESSSLVPGMEVAQIDWDGATTHVDWVTVVAVIAEDGTPYVELNNYVEKGASGGGIFWNGDHIANNWSRLRDRDSEGGEVTRSYGKGALNSAGMLAATLASAGE